MKGKTKNELITEGWVSINEKLPALEESVLLFDEWETHDGEQRKDIRIGYLLEFTIRKTSDGINKHCVWAGTEFAFNITHWMQLPKPPSDGGN